MHYEVLCYCITSNNKEANNLARVLLCTSVCCPLHAALRHWTQAFRSNNDK